jgi:hypothetical protein
MFCQKCGAKSIDGAAFCQKCGTKLMLDMPDSQASVVSATISEPKETVQSRANELTKKKSKKRLVFGIIGVTLAVVIAITIAVFINDDEVATSSGDRNMHRMLENTTAPVLETAFDEDQLTQTYSNDVAGFSFKYPDSWTLAEEGYLLEIVSVADGPVEFSVSEAFDYFDMFTEDTEIVEERMNNAREGLASGRVELSDVVINGIPMKKLASPQMFAQEFHYYYKIGNIVYEITYLYPKNEASTAEPIFNAIMETYTITELDAVTVTPEPDTVITTPEPDTAVDTTLWKTLYQSLINDATPEELDIATMSLVYIDDNDIPELVIDWGIDASGCQVFAVSGDQLISTYASVGGFFYYERNNLFLDSGGQQGMYYDKVLALINGNFETLHEGNYEETDWGSGVYNYFWNGIWVSETEYNNYLNAAFEVAYAKHSRENEMSADALLALLGGSSHASNSLENPSPGEILCNGTPMSQILSYRSIYDVAAVYGNPQDAGYWNGGAYYSYEDFVCFYLPDTGEIRSVGVTANLLHLEGSSGVTLDKKRDALVELFGTPSEEGWSEVDDYMYYITYDFPSYRVLFNFNSPDEVANYSEFWAV